MSMYNLICKRSEDIPIADSLSRLVSAGSEKGKFDVQTLEEELVSPVLVNHETVLEAAKIDDELKKLYWFTMHGWTTVGKKTLSGYFNLRHEFTIHKNLRYRGS